jgi:hypothetical protein
MTQPSNVLNDREVEKVLDKIIEKILKSDPKMKIDPERRATLVKEMAQTLRNEKVEVTRGKLAEPKFADRLFTAMKLALTLDTNKDAINDIKRLFKSKFTPDELKKKLSPADLLKKFSPQELKGMLDKLQKLKTDMKESLKDKLRPKPGAKPQDEKEDDMMNLLGILNHLFTGTLPVVVQCCLGNGRGFPDWGPTYETSTAQIDRQNRISDTNFGDPYGLNAIARDNYIAEGNISTDVVNELIVASRSAPTLSR